MNKRFKYSCNLIMAIYGVRIILSRFLNRMRHKMGIDLQFPAKIQACFGHPVVSLLMTLDGVIVSLPRNPVIALLRSVVCLQEVYPES